MNLASQDNVQHTWVIALQSLTDLSHLAEIMAGLFKPGDVIALNGPLGVGKTTFVKSLAEAWQVHEVVTSPTFVLMNQYWAHAPQQSTFPLIHVDLYRLDGVGDDPSLTELEEIISQKQSVVLIEWANLAPTLQSSLTWTLGFNFSQGAIDHPLADNHRQISVTCLQNDQFMTASQALERWSAV